MDQIKSIIKRIINNNGNGWTITSIIKTTILIIVALFALSIILAMFKWVFNFDDDYKRGGIGLKQIFNNPELMLDYTGDMIDGYDDDRYDDRGSRGHISEDRRDFTTSSISKMIAPMEGLVQDIIPVPYYGGLASKDAEDYETREYRVSYEKSNIEKTCKKFEDLKSLEYVVFSNANKSDSHCNYSFKVEADREQEVILLIKSLGPKEFNANTFTLERSITNNDNEIDILERKIEMLDSLLESAQEKYSKLRNTGNTTASVQAINNEINLIERITNQKLSVQSSIDRLTNRNATQEERIDYSQFNVSVSQKKFIDWGSIGDQWKYAFERFVSSLSEAVQGLSIGLIMFVFSLAKFVTFLSIGVVTIVATAKFLWAISRKIWKK